jgi:hypothetical protein
VTSNLALNKRKAKKAEDGQGVSGTENTRVKARKLFVFKILTSKSYEVQDFARHFSKPRASQGFQRGVGRGYLSTQVLTGTKPSQTRPSSPSIQKQFSANFHSQEPHHSPRANLILNWSLG